MSFDDAGDVADVRRSGPAGGQTVAGLVRACAADLLEVVLPRDCVWCGSAGRLLCPVCAQALAASTPRWDLLRPGSPGGALRVCVGGDLEGPLGAVLRAYKGLPAGIGSRGAGGHSGEAVRSRSLAGPLAQVLGGALEAAVRAAGTECLAVAVPSSAGARWRRGEDVLRVLLARAIARHLDRRLPRPRVPRRPLLRAVRPVSDQRGLDALARFGNVAGSLSGRSGLARIPVVLVDDVLTTGATLGEARRAVVAAGGTVVAAVVIAATPGGRTRATG